jgi:hypothetical protein
MDSIVNYGRKIKERHTEISILADFPPFVDQFGDDFRDAYMKEYELLNDRVQKAAEDGNYGAVVLEEPFAKFEAQFKEELDEARLYLKRYGHTWDGRMQAHEAYKKT